MKSKKKIFFIIPSLISGGAQRTFVNILNAINKNQFICYLVVFRRKGDLFEQLDRNINVISLETKNALGSVIKLSKLIRKVKPHIAFSTLRYINFINILSCYLSFTRVKIIIRETNHHSEIKKNRGLFDYIIDYSYHLANKVIALSNGVKEDIILRTKINPSKISVIYNPVDLEAINLQKKETLTNEDINFEKDILKLVNVGHLEEQKGQEILIKAISKINNIPFKLYIVGEGNNRDYLSKLILELGLSKKVFLLGYKKNPYKFIFNSDIFVLSSLWEGFGHVIVEAMACGTPVIASNCKSGPSEIIHHNYDGILITPGSINEPKSNLIELMNDKSKRNELSKNALEKARKFDREKIIKSYEQVFN